MKNAGALKLMIVGPVTLALSVTTGLLLVYPELRSATDAFWIFAMGAAAGLVIFAPVAAALAFKDQIRRWATRHGYAIQWYASAMMMLALGYLLASIIHRTPDVLTGLAVLILFFGVMAKIVFGIAFRPGTEPPRGGSGPRPPGAPVLRPPGGRPPVLQFASPVPKA